MISNWCLCFACRVLHILYNLYGIRSTHRAMLYPSAVRTGVFWRRWDRSNNVLLLTLGVIGATHGVILFQTLPLENLTFEPLETIPSWQSRHVAEPQSQDWMQNQKTHWKHPERCQLQKSTVSDTASSLLAILEVLFGVGAVVLQRLTWGLIATQNKKPRSDLNHMQAQANMNKIMSKHSTSQQCLTFYMFYKPSLGSLYCLKNGVPFWDHRSMLLWRDI